MARRLAERLKVFSYAVSLGKTRSLIYYIPTEDLLRSSFRLADKARVLSEALPGMLRLLRRRASHFIARITAESSVEIIELEKYIRDK